MTDNKKIAEQVLAAVGGAANLKDATHCMTRLRLYLKDDSLPKDDEVKKKDDNTGRDFKVKRRKERISSFFLKFITPTPFKNQLH